jgi:hypothetical protein
MNENKSTSSKAPVNEIVLKLSFGEVNTIITALSERSFKEVYSLIGKIHAQSNAQLPDVKG